MNKNDKPNYNEIIFTNVQVEDIINSYLNGESSVSIGKRYNISHKPILKLLHKMNIDVDRRSSRKYSVNESYFDCIDTPNKAYILGFLYADGHNGVPKGTLTMSLQEEDFDILEKIRIEIGSEKPLEYLDYSNKHDFGYTYKNQYRLNIFSTHICKTLEKIGMISNKSLFLEFPNIPEYLYSHFIRGYLDGDGTITKTGTIGFVSTENFLIAVENILFNSLEGIGHGRIVDASCHNGITRNLLYTKQKDSKIILTWLYHDADLYLERKYNRFINAIYNAA